MLMSRMLTSALKPAAIFAAFAPTTPPPRIVIVRRRHAGHAAEQNAATHLRAFQILGAFLNAHAAGDFAHRREQRQAALVVGERFVRHGRAAGGEHRFGERAIRGEVEIGEHDLPGANQRPFARACGSLTFTIMSARAKISCGVGDQSRRRSATYSCVGESRAQTRRPAR